MTYKIVKTRKKKTNKNKQALKPSTKQKHSLEDRISSLPDALIIHILSFVDTELAVQTAILSKRWLHLWKYIPALNINGQPFLDEFSLHNFISQFLTSHEISTVHTLIFHRSPEHDDFGESKSIIPKLIHYVVSRKVQHVELRSDFNVFDQTDNPYDSLLATKSLTTLKLHEILLSPVPSFNLPSLKTLSLHHVVFNYAGDDCLLAKIFLGCVNLEHLELSTCLRSDQMLPNCDFRNNLTSSSLKTLRLYEIGIIQCRVGKKDEIIVSDVFAGFLSLENLEISSCQIYDAHVFIISSPKLVNLKISDVTFYKVEKTKVVVSSPKLTSFKIEMDRFFGCVESVRDKLTSSVELILDNITSLQNLDFHTTKKLCPEIPSTEWLEDNFATIVNFFESLSRVKSLCLTLDAVKLLALFTDVLENQICPLEILETMKVRGTGSKKVRTLRHHMKVIRYLCSGSPNLKEMDVLLE